MKANKAAANVLILAALATAPIGCKEMRQKNAIVNGYTVQIDSLWRAKERAQERHDSTFNATVAEIQKEYRADSTLLASGKATGQDSFGIEFKGHLVYPVVVHNLKVQIIENSEKQAIFQQKIDSLQTRRDGAAMSAYGGMHSLDDVILVGAMAVVFGIMVVAVVAAQFGESISAGFKKLFGKGSALGQGQ